MIKSNENESRKALLTPNEITELTSIWQPYRREVEGAGGGTSNVEEPRTCFDESDFLIFVHMPEESTSTGR